MTKKDQKELFAFVIIPFNNKTEDRYKLAIQGAVEEVENIKAERLDDQLYEEGMLERIHRQIELADIIIADLTDKNPNVFYELGYAHANKKLSLHITDNADNIPFDLKHKPHIVYSNINDLKEKLIINLKWAQDKVHSERTAPFQVVQKNINGYLEKDNWRATADIDFDFELRSNSNKAIQINGIYFHTGREYQVKMDGKSCHRSDLKTENGYKNSYYLDLNKTLHPDGWLPLKFSIKRVLATILNEELKDEYQLKGKAQLKFVTDSGPILHNLEINLTLSDVPF